MKQDYWTYNKPLSMTGFGGGATSLSNAGVAALPYANDLEYAGFFSTNANPINISNSSYDQGGTPFSALDYVFDNFRSKIYTGYQYVGSYGWSNAGSTYNNNASFYNATSSFSYFNGYSNVQYGRGATIAYLQDGTSVFVTNTLQAAKIHFWDIANNNYLGYLNLTQGTNALPSTVSMRGIAYSGTHLLVNDASGASSNNSNYGSQKLYGYDLPANIAAINNSTSLSPSLIWSVPTGVGSYGLAWGGGNRIYTTYVGSSGGTSTTMYQLQLTDNGLNGTSSQVSTYTAPANIYGCGIDYYNRKLVISGFNMSQTRVYGE